MWIMQAEPVLVTNGYIAFPNTAVFIFECTVLLKAKVKYIPNSKNNDRKL